MWGNRHIRQALDNLVALCTSCRLAARSSEMLQLMGRHTNATGRAFTEQVASNIARRSDLIVRKEVKSIGPLKIERSPGQTLGDVDVLVADPVRRQLWAIEVKNFAVARTPAELSNEIAQILRSRDGQSAAAERTKRGRARCINILGRPCGGWVWMSLTAAVGLCAL